MLTPEIYARVVPDEWKAKLASGLVKVVGNLILPTSGPNQILAHLQPTGLTDTVASLALSAPGVAAGGPLSVLASIGNLATGGYTAYQTTQIRAAIDTLQSLQMGAMALSGVGIGVSIAGFAVLSHKLGKIDTRMRAMDDKIDRIAKDIDDMKAEAIESDFDRLRTAGERVDEAWHVADPEPQWRSAAEELHGLQNRFARRIRRVIVETEDFGVADPLLEAFALAGTTRVSARMAAGDSAAALHAGEAFHRELSALTTPIGAASLLSARLAADGITPGSPEYLVAVRTARAGADAQADGLRSREAMAATAPLTLRHLNAAGISGRDWLETARHEHEGALLFLPVRGGVG